MAKEKRDLVVIGGGPAGSTLAALVKKHNPDRRVLLLERTAFPRHHVGESLLPEIVPILKELGVLEKIDAAGFPRKVGITYVWGATRAPWDVNFGDLKEILGQCPGDLKEPRYAWQVQRSIYDKILLDHARERGVEVRHGWAATGALEKEGNIRGVKVCGPDGKAGTVEAGFVADCSGQGAFLSRYRRIRDYNDKLKNVACYAYFRGARWKFEYTGHPDKTRVFICSVENGWFWYIPINDGLVSVGFVTTAEHVARSKTKDLRALYEKALKACGEIWPLVEGAEWVKDLEGTGKDFFTLSDWSYLCRAAAGPGWIAAGDAAVFIDPILSSGVTLAHLSAHRAAYTIGSWWAERSARRRARLLEDYSEFYREAAASFLLLVLHWYGHDRCAEDWWAEARKAVGVPFIKDKDAFAMISSGLASVYERLQTVRSVMLEGNSGNQPFLRHVLGGAGAQARPVADGDVPRLLYPYEVRDSFLPVPDTGRLAPASKIRFIKKPGDDPVWGALNPKRHALKPHVAILGLIDGRRSVADIRSGAASELGVSDRSAELLTSRFLQELLTYDVLTFS